MVFTLHEMAINPYVFKIIIMFMNYVLTEFNYERTLVLVPLPI